MRVCLFFSWLVSYCHPLFKKDTDLNLKLYPEIRDLTENHRCKQYKEYSYRRSVSSYQSQVFHVIIAYTNMAIFNIAQLTETVLMAQQSHSHNTRFVLFYFFHWAPDYAWFCPCYTSKFKRLLSTFFLCLAILGSFPKSGKNSMPKSQWLLDYNFFSSPQMNALNLLGYRHGRCPHIHFIHCLTGDIRRLPAQEDHLLQVFNCVILDADKAEGIYHAVTHGDTLNDVKSYKGVLLAGDERRMKVTQDCEAVVRRPTHDVRCQNPNEDHHCLAATT